MRHHLPPPFGTLRSVVPIQQAQKRGPWRLTLVSLEIWDNCWAANLDIDRDPFGSEEDDVSPFLTLDAFGEGAQGYVSGFGGAYGGGRLDGGQQHRQLVPFSPAIDPASESVRLEARLQLRRTATGTGSRAMSLDDPPDWEDPEPWVFAVPRTGANGQSSAKPSTSSRPSQEDSFTPRLPYELGNLLWVVPVVAEQTAGDWTVTIISAEVRARGVLLNYRLLGPNQRNLRERMTTPHLRFADERNHEIPSLAGGGSGIPDPRGQHWRGDYHAAVPPGTHNLRIRADEIHLETIEEDPDNPGMARLVATERIPFGWEISIPLR